MQHFDLANLTVTPTVRESKKICNEFVRNSNQGQSPDDKHKHTRHIGAEKNTETNCLVSCNRNPSLENEMRTAVIDKGHAN